MHIVSVWVEFNIPKPLPAGPASIIGPLPATQSNTMHLI